MHLHALLIKNYQSVVHLALEELPRTVVIAGPNGSGKSTVLNAIRLLKSSAAFYDSQEISVTIRELGLQPNNNDSFSQIFFNPNEPIFIEAQISLSNRDKDYLRKHGRELTYSNAMSQILQRQTFGGPQIPKLLTNLFEMGRLPAEQQKKTQRIAGEQYDKMISELSQDRFTISLKILPNGKTETIIPLPIFFALSSFLPGRLGSLLQKSAHRAFQRVPTVSINFNQAQEERPFYAEQLHTKQILANHFIRKILLEKVNVETDDSTLDAIKELFARFLPGKTFNGPQITPDGKITFPVQLKNGKVHDLDDLSSGEKELIYGYVDLVQLGLKDSIIVIDEPEVHLNPRMVKGLIDYYDKYFSVKFNNQMIFTSHSDVLVRDLVSTNEVSVVHLDAGVDLGQNQAIRVDHFTKRQKLLYDLVGDKAAFLPAGKVLIIEGQRGSIDEIILGKLFTEMVGQMNIVSGGTKGDVKKLLKTLREMADDDGGLEKILAIVDRDYDVETGDSAIFMLDRYSIENYLIEPKYIAEAINIFRNKFLTEDKIKDVLLRSCQTVYKKERVHALKNRVADALFENAKIRVNPDSRDIVSDLSKAFDAAKLRISKLELPDLAESNFSATPSLDEMIRSLPGKKILAEFVGKFDEIKNIGPEKFAILIIERMNYDKFVPESLKVQLETILKTSA